MSADALAYIIELDIVLTTTFNMLYFQKFIQIIMSNLSNDAHFR